MKALPDKRSLCFPDEPYSAYCKLCWQAVYIGWVDRKDHHQGECLEGRSNMADCTEAMDMERVKGEIFRAVEESKLRGCANRKAANAGERRPQ